MGPPSTDNPTTLFTHRFSPYALRVQVAMVEKGIPFNAVVVDFKNKPKELLDANPLYGKVPSLVHNGNNVVESLVILEYLDEAFPDTVPLLPKDPLARSKCRFWADYIYKSFSGLVKSAIAAPGTPERESGAEKCGEYARMMDAIISEFSKEGPFFCGETFGYLDVVMAPSVCWGLLFGKIGFNMPDDVPRLKKYLEAISEHEAVKEVVPTEEELLEYWVKVVRGGQKLQYL